MLPGLKRKSVQPMAAALGVPEQNLGHFAGVAAWDWHEVTARLAARAVALLAPTAWVLDDHPFLRAGKHIACAKKQYAGNGPPKLCQVGVSWHAVSPRGSTPLDWRLFMPEAWADDPARRAAARIPDELTHRTKPELALEMLDELAVLGLRPPLALADSLYGQNVSFRQCLEDRHVPCLLAIPGQTTLISATGEPVMAWAREDDQENAYAMARRIRFGPTGFATASQNTDTRHGTGGSPPRACTWPAPPPAKPPGKGAMAATCANIPCLCNGGTSVRPGRRTPTPSGSG
jgi:SRSO17 transposase